MESQGINKETNSKATKNLLFNIKYTLSEVLNSARKETLTNSDVEVARNWTDYCEKVYYCSSNKNNQQVLDNYIKKIVSRIKDCVVPNADFYFLKFFTKTLFFMLLQNIKIDFENYACALEMFAAYGLENKDLEMPLYIIKGTNNLFDSVGIGDTNILTYDKWLKLGAGFLLYNILNRISKEENSTKCEMSLKSYLNTLRRNKTRLLFLLLAANESNLCFRQTCIKIQNYIINWCVDEMFNTQISSAFLQQPPNILSEIAIKNKEFFEEYLKILLLNGQKLEPQYLSDGYKWNYRDMSEFSTLVDHFHCLLNKDSHTGAVTKQIFIKLLEVPGCCVWEDIRNECDIRDEWTS